MNNPTQQKKNTLIMGKLARIITATSIVVLGLVGLLIAFEMLCLGAGSQHIKRTQRVGYNGTLFLPEIASKEAAAGKRAAANARLVVMGLCFNLGDNVQRARAVIDRYRQPFKDSRVVLFENDSTDGTRERLEAWAAEDSSVHILDCCAQGSCRCKLKSAAGYDNGFKSSSRIERMTDYRNRCLAWAAENVPDYEYALVLDMDLQGAVTPDAIEDALGSREETPWDSVHPNSRMPLYGSFGVLTHTYDSLSFLTTPAKLKNFSEKQITYNKLLWRWFLLNLKNGKRANLVRVGALFNGMGLYDFQTMKRSKYTPFTCEHIGLQQGMQNALHRNGRFYLSQNWLVHSGHQGPKLW